MALQKIEIHATHVTNTEFTAIHRLTHAEQLQVHIAQMYFLPESFQYIACTLHLLGRNLQVMQFITFSRGLRMGKLKFPIPAPLPNLTKCTKSKCRGSALLTFHMHFVKPSNTAKMHCVLFKHVYTIDPAMLC